MITIIKITANLTELLLYARHYEFHIHHLIKFSLLSNVDNIFNPDFIDEENEA